MRTMLKLQLPVEAGNDAIRTGRIGEVLGAVGERLQPEAMYFGTEDGKRTAYVFFDLKDPSAIPVIAEPLFQDLNASVHFAPVMSLEELQKGLGDAAQR
jgi:hypothetical protein